MVASFRQQVVADKDVIAPRAKRHMDQLGGLRSTVGLRFVCAHDISLSGQIGVLGGICVEPFAFTEAL